MEFEREMGALALARSSTKSPWGRFLAAFRRAERQPFWPQNSEVQA